MRKTLLLLFGVILFFVLIFFKLDFSGFTHIVSEKLSWMFYILISLSIIIQLIVRSLRFNLLFNNVFENKIPLPKSFLLTSASFFVALATPNKLGDMVRGFFVKGQTLEITAITIIEYLFDVLIVLIIPAFGLLFLYHYYFFEIVAVYVVLALGLVVLLSLFKYSFFKNILNKVKWYRKSKDKIEILKLYFREGLKNKVVLLTGFLFTCLFYGVYFVIFYAVLQRLGAQTTFLQTLLAAGVGVFLGSITFIPMGLGTRDATAYGVLMALGTNSDLALSSVVIIRSLSLVLILVSGLCYFLAVRRF